MTNPFRISSNAAEWSNFYPQNYAHCSPFQFDQIMNLYLREGVAANYEQLVRLGPSSGGGFNPLCLAADRGNEALARHLFRNRPDLLELGCEAGLTPLAFSVLSGNIQLVQFFLESGANPNQATLQPIDDRTLQKGEKLSKGATILDLAIKSGNIGIQNLLKRYGASLSLIEEGLNSFLPPDITNIVKKYLPEF